MKIEQRRAGDITILDIEGRLTMNDGRGQLKTLVADLIDRNHVQVLLNLADLRYLDSACLGEIINSHIKLSRKDGKLKLLNMPDHLAELLKLAGLTGIFETFSSETDAVQSFQAPAS